MNEFMDCGAAKERNRELEKVYLDDDDYCVWDWETQVPPATTAAAAADVMNRKWEDVLGNSIWLQAESSSDGHYHNNGQGEEWFMLIHVSYSVGEFWSVQNPKHSRLIRGDKHFVVDNIKCEVRLKLNDYYD